MINPNENPSSFSILHQSGPPPPLDMEFKAKRATEIFHRHALATGRCFGSKSGYKRAYPKNEFIPNANVFCKRHGKVWFGDLDLTFDKPALEKIARRLRCRLYVLREGDGRFKNANQPHAEVLENAVWHTGGLLRRIPGAAKFFCHSRLSHSEAAFLLRLSRGRLTRPQPPKIALEIGRRMRRFERVFGPIAQKAGHKNWGHWWVQPSDKLAGRSPLQVLKVGETLDLGKFAVPTMELALFGLVLSSWETL